MLLTPSTDGLPAAPLPTRGNRKVPVPTANGAACFNTGGSSSNAHGDLSLQECLTPVLVLSGGASSAPGAAILEIDWKGLR